MPRPRRPWRLAVALFCALVAALLSSPARPGQHPARASSIAPSVLVVEPDDGRQPVLDYIASAQQSLDVEIYELTDRRILTALEDAAGRGVRVRVMAEPRPDNKPVNASALADLARKGVLTRDSSPSFRLTHEKAMVADGVSALVMTMNLVAQTFDNTRDFALLDTDTADVAEIESVFESDWNHLPAGVDDPALVWSPDNSRGRLLSLLNSATSRLDIYAEELTDRDVLAALSSAAAAGVRVRLLMTDTGSHDPARAGRALIQASGAQVRLQPKPFVHAKVVIADGSIAFTGSENFTAASLDSNRELGLLTTDDASVARLTATFEQDWSRPVPAPRP
ncbi:MAG TPA: phospholipase D-like domain-containing protein [Dehalococcoidia bacterium]|nr:phospholipase D-like domain-containing protein [Dehalococcoidia bacterium]